MKGGINGLRGGMNRKIRRLPAADGRAAGAMAGWDGGYRLQCSTAMLLDSMGDERVGGCTLSPLAHLEPKAVTNGGRLRSQGTKKQVWKVLLWWRRRPSLVEEVRDGRVEGPAMCPRGHRLRQCLS